MRGAGRPPKRSTSERAGGGGGACGRCGACVEHASAELPAAVAVCGAAQRRAGCCPVLSLFVP
jgi:hypothetical protein